MPRTKANVEQAQSERIDFLKRTVTIPGTSLPAFDIPDAEMSVADLFAFVRKCRGAAELFPAKTAKAEG